MSLAFVFPGQGSQAVGMGKELAKEFKVAADVFNEIDDALGQKLSSLMWEGPKEELTLTENAQPALMAVSIAVMRVLEKENGFILKDKVKYVAGHSLGEYSALAAVGSFTLIDAARLLKLRGQAMQRAVPVGLGAMTALLGVDLEIARKITQAAAQGDVCEIANDNEPTQVVLSGHKTAIERVPEVGKGLGLRRSIPLPVSAPFHCSLMLPAQKEMSDALSVVSIKQPVVPLICNVLASEIIDPEQIRQCLIQQVTGTVRWRESINYMASHGITDIVEIGAGKVLSGLAKRINSKINSFNIEYSKDFSEFNSKFF